jgi:hypothetical protein
MTLNADNLVFFYLTLGVLALAIAVALYATRRDSKGTKRHD